MSIVFFSDRVQFLCHFQIFSKSVSWLISSHLEFIIVLCFCWMILVVRWSLSVPKLHCWWVSVILGWEHRQNTLPTVRSEMVPRSVRRWALLRHRVCWVSQCTLGDLSLWSLQSLLRPKGYCAHQSVLVSDLQRWLWGKRRIVLYATVWNHAVFRLIRSSDHILREGRRVFLYLFRFYSFLSSEKLNYLVLVFVKPRSIWFLIRDM